MLVNILVNVNELDSGSAGRDISLSEERIIIEDAPQFNSVACFLTFRFI